MQDQPDEWRQICAVVNRAYNDEETAGQQEKSQRHGHLGEYHADGKRNKYSDAANERNLSFMTLSAIGPVGKTDSASQVPKNKDDQYRAERGNQKR